MQNYLYYRVRHALRTWLRLNVLRWISIQIFLLFGLNYYSYSLLVLLVRLAYIKFGLFSFVCVQPDFAQGRGESNFRATSLDFIGKWWINWKNESLNFFLENSPTIWPYFGIFHRNSWENLAKTRQSLGKLFHLLNPLHYAPE